MMAFARRGAQQGVALLALLAVLMLMATGFVLGRLNTETGGAKAVVRERNAAVLNRAKQALIGYVALQAVKASEANPGSLPCPEDPANFASTTNQGVSAASCGTVTVGRLPWTTLGIDGISAAACAAVLACGAVVSERKVRGADAFWGAAAAGGLLGIAALLSYGAAWFAVSLLCLFYARRRSAQILVAAASALAVLALAAMLGNSWPYGLVDTYNAAIGEIAAHPGQLWWLLLMPALVCVACGPAIIESLRRFGSSAAWPLMIGPLLALMIAPLSGSNPEQPEYGWIALCPWLIVAATAPRIHGANAAGKPGETRMRSVRVPLVTAGAGACAAIVLMYSG